LVGGPCFFLTSCLVPFPLPPSPNAESNGYPLAHSPSLSFLRVAGKEIRLSPTDLMYLKARIKKKTIFSSYTVLYKEIEMRAVAKSCIYEEGLPNI
jgi:hypothetical protein